MLDFGDFISNCIDPDVPRLRDARLSIQGRIDSFVNIEHGKIPSRVVLAPTEPPLAILEGMIDGYFSNINPQFPIWSKTTFQKIVTSLREHTTCAEDQWASIVCCNNLILINLTTDAVHSVQRRMAQSGSTESFPSMESDLIARFLANSKRAMENLGLISPRLINLQALLSSVSLSPAMRYTPKQLCELTACEHKVYCSTGTSFAAPYGLRICPSRPLRRDNRHFPMASSSRQTAGRRTSRVQEYCTLPLHIGQTDLLDCRCVSKGTEIRNPARSDTFERILQTPGCQSRASGHRGNHFLPGIRRPCQKPNGRRGA
jgi:hypothetical protein